MTKAIKFERMTEANIYGYAIESEKLGLTIEVVRCYEHDWNVFLTRNGSVVARSLREYRECGNGYVDRYKAFTIARELAM